MSCYDLQSRSCSFADVCRDGPLLWLAVRLLFLCRGLPWWDSVTTGSPAPVPVPMSAVMGLCYDWQSRSCSCAEVCRDGTLSSIVCGSRVSNTRPGSCLRQCVRCWSDGLPDRRLTDTWPTDIWATDKRPTDIYATDTRPTDIWATDTWPTDIWATDTRPTDIWATDTRPTYIWATDTRPTDTWPMDTIPTGTRMTDTSPTDRRTTETWPTDTGRRILENCENRRKIQREICRTNIWQHQQYSGMHTNGLFYLIWYFHFFMKLIINCIGSLGPTSIWPTYPWLPTSLASYFLPTSLASYFRKEWK